jgi:hypothetical protein
MFCHFLLCELTYERLVERLEKIERAEWETLSDPIKGNAPVLLVTLTLAYSYGLLR